MCVCVLSIWTTADLAPVRFRNDTRLYWYYHAMRCADISGVRGGGSGNPLLQYGMAYCPWIHRHDGAYYYFLMGSILVNVCRQRRLAMPCTGDQENENKKTRWFFCREKIDFPPATFSSFRRFPFLPCAKINITAFLFIASSFLDPQTVVPSPTVGRKESFPGMSQTFAPY